MRRAGFTLIELLVALVLLAMIADAIYQVLWVSRRAYHRQLQQVALHDNLRAAAGVLPAELRQLDAGDSIESDILVMGRDSLVYKAMRAVYTVCARPVVASPTGGNIVVRAEPWFGLRPLDSERDGVLLYTTRGRWLHAQPAGSPAPGTACPGPSPSLAIRLQAVTPRGFLDSVELGAPLRTYEIVKLRAYRGGGGEWWLGVQSRRRTGRWSSTEPVLGPLAGAGLALAFFDAAGTETADRTRVARIRIALVMRGPKADASDTLVTEVALRGNAP